MAFLRRVARWGGCQIVAILVAAAMVGLVAAPSLAGVTPSGALVFPAAPVAGVAFPLHTSGAQIVDAAGKRVKLDLVNWYGAESPDYVVGGLAYQPVTSIISQIVSMGFNGVRLPWSNQMWESNPVVSSSLVAANPQFAGEHARTVFQQVITDLASAGLMVVLDNHTSDAQSCCSGSDGNTLWYNAAYPESSWLADWQQVAQAFKNVPQVIGADLRNEPRGAAAWGGSDPAVDWHAAAQRGGNAVLSVAPHWLIFVEGTGYAHNLAGVASLPVSLSIANQVVYSVHDYGFQHQSLTSYDSWVAAIQPGWGWMVGKYPLWVGEFGTCNTADTCVTSSNSRDLGWWFSIFTRYLRYHDLDWAYWPLNGTQSDGLPGQGRSYGATETYGILDPAWAAPSRALLLSSLQAIQPTCAPAPLARSSPLARTDIGADQVKQPWLMTT